jgi:CRISPR-associated protein Csd1
MILQRLAEYYDRLREDAETSSSLPVLGYSLQKISFCIVLDQSGNLVQFQDLREKESKRAIPKQMLVPGGAKPSGQGLNPCFLWDNAAYLLGFKPDDDKPERTRRCFEAFRDRHMALASEIPSAAFHAVCEFLRNWAPETIASYGTELHEMFVSFGVFRIAGERRYVHEDPRVREYWEAERSSAEGSSLGMCLVTGKIQPIARLHEPKIKGVAGAQSSGALLVSFNDSSYCSFGKEQSFNAPVSESIAFRYTNALNHLLNQRARRVQIGDATVVYWAERATVLEEFVSDLFGEPFSADAGSDAENLTRAEQVRLFLSQLRSGVGHSEAIDTSDPTRFYVLGLGPNASRLCVRFWIDSTVEEMEQRLGQHLRDVELIRPGDEGPPLSIRRLVQATGRFKGKGKGYDNDSVSPLLAAAVSRAVLSGTPYPLSLLTAMVGRIRRDGEVSHERVAAIKACLCRLQRLRRTTKEVSVGLDRERMEPAYLAGRLFAALERVQTDALGRDLNTTIKDKYFSSACATPAVVFPRLIRLNTFHLAKLDGGLRVVREKLVGEIVSGLDRFPKFLNLEEQGLFTIGYFHQRQDFFMSNRSEGETE